MAAPVHAAPHGYRPLIYTPQLYTPTPAFPAQGSQWWFRSHYMTTHQVIGALKTYRHCLNKARH